MTLYQIQGQEKNKISIGKLICLARTYVKHAQEMNTTPPLEPVLFLKPESAVIFSGDSILLPKQSQNVHHEVELGVIIGKQGKNVSTEEAMDYVFGYCIALDITARDIQSQAKEKGWPWSIAKGFDTFAPISKVIPKQFIKDPHNLIFSLMINGEQRQQATTKDLLFSIPEIIAYISSIMTLKQGDLIMTGTPEGVGELHEGDTIEAHLEDYVTLKVEVKKP